MPDLPEQATGFTLSRAEALVLFEFLSRFDEEDELRIDHPAEEQVLANIHGVLQRELVEPLMPEYVELLQLARSAVHP